MAKAESSETDAESRPIRRAVIAETGKLYVLEQRIHEE